MSKVNKYIVGFLFLAYCLGAVIICRNGQEKFGDTEKEIVLAKEKQTEKFSNPYFFPEDVSTVEYSAKFDFKDGEDGIAGEAELSVSKVNVFQDGILYKLKAGSDVEAFDEKGILVKRDYSLGYFYVEEERISFIRNNEMESGVTEMEVVDMGTVVCQSESWKESRITSGTKGWHGRIEVIEDKCFFGDIMIWKDRNMMNVMNTLSGKKGRGWQDTAGDAERMRKCVCIWKGWKQSILPKRKK